VEKVIVFGNATQALLSYFLLTHDSPYQVVAFTVDGKYLKERELQGLPVLAFDEIESVYPPDSHKMHVPVLGWTPKLRAEKYNQAKAKGYELINYISSKAVTWPGLVIGDNCSIAEGSICRPFVEIGNDVLIQAGCIIGHNTVIKDHCFIASHAVLLGMVTVEPYTFIGANATIDNGVTIAGECIIGAGTVIRENTQEKGVYRGASPTLLPQPSDKLAKILFKR
jgi:sugar O-acyltransferase (sialic acid O-acetyltransferase NeuD family)